MKKIVLIDGNSLLHRAFHAIPPFRSPEGELVNAVYGFFSMLLNIFIKENPGYIAIAFDRRAPTYRHLKYTEYKAKRVKAPDELYEQIPKIKECLEAFKMPIFEADGFEADDAIATLAHKLEKIEDIEILIATGDKDAFQLITEKTKVLSPEKGFRNSTCFNLEKIKEKYELTAGQMIDYKSLRGDPSDNIPGVKGIGKKTATNLLKQHETLESIYDNLSDLKNSIRERLEENKDMAFLSKELVTLQKDGPFEIEIADAKIDFENVEELKIIWERFGFKSLLRRLTFFEPSKKVKIIETNPQQSLF